MTTRQIFTTSNARIKISRKQFSNGQESATISGYAIVWDETSTDRGGYFVRLAPNSALFTNPVLALWSHDITRPLASTANETLRILAADEIGVPVEIDLDTATTTGADTLAYVASQLVGGMSFSMANGFEDYAESEEMDATTGKKQKILTVSKFTCDEVSPVAAPAFSATTLAVKPVAEVMPLEPLPAGTPPVAGGMSTATPNRIAAGHQLHRLKLQLAK